MIDLKISKELINQVYPVILEALGDSYKAAIIEDTIYFCQNSKVIINYNLLFSSNGEQQFELSLESFVFKCKDWALSKGYFIYSTHELSFIKSLSLETIETFANGKDTEIECIIKASEWILSEVNK